MKKQYLTINQAAQRLGVSAKTLRRWEEKGILTPKRSIGNQRRYLLSDIEKREKKAFTINEAAARLYVSANTLRRWEAKGIITPKRSIGNQRLYTLADIQKIEAMHYPTIEKEETTTTEQALELITATPSVIARSEATKQSQVDNKIAALPVYPEQSRRAYNDNEEMAEKERFFDLASVEPSIETTKPTLPPYEAISSFRTNQTVNQPVKADEPYIEDPPPKRKFSWHIKRPSKQLQIAAFSFAGIILLLSAVTTLTTPIQLFSIITSLNGTKNIKLSSNQEVLQAATKKKDFALRFNVPAEFTQTASISGKLTAPNILYGVVAGDNITISGDTQNPTISANPSGVKSFQGQTGDLALAAGSGISINGLTISSTEDTFKNIKIGSDTISAGSTNDTFEFAAGSGISFSTDTTNKKLTITSSSTGLTGLTTNGVLYANSASTALSLTPGTSGYILQSNGSGSPPAWVSSSSLNTAFSSITDGTNTSAAMVVGTGASLTYSGGTATSGVINANQLLGGTWAIPGSIGATTPNSGAFTTVSVTPSSDTTALTLTGTNVTTQKLAYFNAKNASGTIFDISYGTPQTLTGSLIGQAIDLNNGQVTATNQNVTGQKITLPTLTNTNAAGTENLLGLQVTFGSGAGINQNGAGATVFSDLDVTLPALTQTSGTLTANGLAVTTPSSITTNGTANGILISPTGVGAGTLNGVNVATISAAGAGNETALNVGSGWDTVLRVNGAPVINGQGITLSTGGGTGQSSYAVGDMLYAGSASTLTKLAIGNTDGYVLKVSGGVPTWGAITGSSCTNCLINNPTSTATNTIAPTGQTTTGLTVKQTSTASPTNDIFDVTDSTGSTVYFKVDNNGNVYPSNSIGNTLTLTPTTDTTALTLVGTNVPTASLQYINSKNQQGTIFNLAYGAVQTLSTTTALNGIGVDLASNVTATNATVTGENLTLPSPTNTNTSGTKFIKGITISAGGGLNQNGAGGTTTYAAFDATIPPLTQTAGTLNGYGVNVTTPSSITTGGTAAALNVTASGVGAGNLYGLNISGITAGAGTETALNIGSGWDNVLKVNGTTVIDGSGNFNITNATGILPVANGGSPFEQNLGAIFPRITSQDLLLGGTASNSATFHVFGASPFQGTNPVASIAANTSFAGLVVNNSGAGDLLTASSSGLTRFVIKQNGDIQLGNYTGSPNFTLAGSDLNTTGPSMTWAEDPARYMRARYDSSANRLIFENDTGNPIFAMGRGGTNSVGIGTTTFNATLDVKGNATNGGTVPTILAEGPTSKAALVIDNSGVGDLFAASASGTNRFVITNAGNVGIGISNPTQTLQVIGLTQLAGNSAFSASNALEIGNDAIFADYDTANSISLNGVSTSTEGGLRLGSGGGTLYGKSGNIGIGTTSPGSRLTVAASSGTGTMVVDNECGGNYTGISLNGTIGGTCGTGYNFLSSPTDKNLYLNRPTGSTMYFRQNNGDEMQINSSGNVGIGAAPSYRLDVQNSVATNFVASFQNNNGSGYGIRDQIRTTGSPVDFMVFYSLNGTSDYVNGWITGSGGGIAYNSTSDIRLKENIVDTHYGINDLMKVRVADFNYIKTPNDPTTGFLAQQLYAIYPPAVTTGTSGNDLSKPWSVDYGKLTPLIIKGVQEQQGQLETLKASVSAIIAGSLNTDSLTVNNLQTQNLTLGSTNVNDKLIGLESGIASVSAGFASPLADLQTQVLSLSDRVASLEATLTTLTASNSALFMNNPLGNFTASTGAELSLDKLNVNSSIIADSLNVLSYATINELSVTGSIRTGVLTINGQSNGGASISTLNGDLRLQEQRFGGIDILNGLVTVDTSGNITSQGTITAKKLNLDETDTLSASIGQGTIPLNGTNAIIYTTAVTNGSHIFVTPRTKTPLPLSVTSQVAGGYFKVEITSPAPHAIKFDWWILN